MLNIFCVQCKKAFHMGLEQHKSQSARTVFILTIALSSALSCWVHLMMKPLEVVITAEKACRYLTVFVFQIT